MHSYNYQKLQAIIQLTRWRQHIPFVLPLTVMGAMLAIYHHDLSPDWLLGAILVANILGMSCAFIINDLADAEDDALDPDKLQNNVISNGTLSKEIAMAAFIILATIAFLLYVISGTWPAIGGAIGLVLAYMYSIKPYQLKARPVIDLITHGIGGGSLQVAISYFAYHQSPGVAWYVIIGMTFGSIYGQLYNQLDDFEVDNKARINNTTQILGKNSATILMYLSALIAGFCLILAINQGAFPDWLGTVFLVSIFTCSLFVWKIDMRGNSASIPSTLQIPTLLTLNMVTLLWLSSALGFL